MDHLKPSHHTRSHCTIHHLQTVRRPFLKKIAWLSVFIAISPSFSITHSQDFFNKIIEGLTAPFIKTEPKKAPLLPPSSPLPTPTPQPYSYAPIVKKTAPAVVSLVVTLAEPDQKNPLQNDPLFQFFFGREKVQTKQKPSVGSGVIVDPKGVVITCAHVVKNAATIIVKLSDNRQFQGKIAVFDEKSDLAAIQLTNLERDTTLPFIEMDNDDLYEVGDIVLAIGNPFGVGQTVSNGIISASTRNVQGRILMQTDAPINPGNSGGALVDMSGRLVGIPNAILSKTGSSSGIGFAIPTATIRPILEAVYNDGKVHRYWDGLFIQTLPHDAAESLGLSHESGGVMIVDLHPKSPALRAGIKIGDVILRANGQSFSTAEDFVLYMNTLRLGQKIAADIYRQKAVHQITYELAEAPEDPPADKNTFPTGHLLAGLTVANLSPAISLAHNVTLRDKGVVILETENSPMATSIGLNKGDIIESISGQKVDSVNTLRKLTTASNGVLLIVRRGRQVIQIRVN